MRRSPPLGVFELLFQLRFFFRRRRRNPILQAGDDAFQGGLRIGMDGDGRIAEHGLRACGRDGHMGRFPRFGIDHRVAEVPEMAGHGLVKDLVVGHGGLEVGIPVDQPVASINQLFFEEAEECVAHGPGADGIEGESRSLPVATATHFLELTENSFFVGIFPLPDALDEPFATELVAGHLLLEKEPFLNDRLGGDAGMVGAGHPEGLVALHAFLADEDVLKGVVQGVAEVQGAGHVGRRNDDRVGLAIGPWLAVEVALLFPEGVPAFLGGGVIVLFGQVVEKAVGHGFTGGRFR